MKTFRVANVLKRKKKCNVIFDTYSTYTHTHTHTHSTQHSRHTHTLNYMAIQQYSTEQYTQLVNRAAKKRQSKIAARSRCICYDYHIIITISLTNKRNNFNGVFKNIFPITAIRSFMELQFAPSYKNIQQKE